MLVTDDFVMLNFPKTGSSFARAVIKEVYSKRYAGEPGVLKTFRRLLLGSPSGMCRELLLPNIKVSGENNSADQHGTYAQIPARYCDRKIISIVRNPYSRFMSGYEFQYWKEHPNIPRDMIEKHLPNFPDISVDDYVRFNQLQLVHGRLGGKEPNAMVGNQTVQFIQMFFKHPDDVLKNLTDDYLDSDNIFFDMADIYFLRQENLRDDLIAFLNKVGVPLEEMKDIQTRESINVTHNRGMSRSHLWTPLSLAYVKESERMMIRILRERGISCPVPKINGSIQ